MQTGAIAKSEPEQMQLSARRMYWPQLDGLRFLAAVLVFFAHAPVLPLGIFKLFNRFGWCGVDLFLVLSAFLLTQLLRAEAEKTGTIDIKHFYMRRILRIWPLHWGFVTAMLCVHLLAYRDTIRQAVGFWLSHIFFINNVVLATLGFEKRLAFTSHLWTISLEEQFYLVIPLLVLWFSRRLPDHRKLLLGLGAFLMVLMGARAACALLDMRYPFIWALPLRGDAIGLGLVLGLGSFKDYLNERRSLFCFISGGGILVASWYLPSLEAPGWQQVPGFTIMDIGCCLLVAGVMVPNVITAALSNRVFRYFGKISFGIYVYHVLAIAIGKFAMQNAAINSPWLSFAVSLVLTICMASVSYELFEKRFLRLKERFSIIKSRPV
jgi:peptidoglycan/LPS O-acetylase OafA/YrhL